VLLFNDTINENSSNNNKKQDTAHQDELNNQDQGQSHYCNNNGNSSSSSSNANHNHAKDNNRSTHHEDNESSSMLINSVNSFGSINTANSNSLCSLHHTPQQSPTRSLSTEIVARKKAMKEDEVRHRIKRLGKSQNKKMKENEMRSRLGKLTRRKSAKSATAVRSGSAGEEVEEEEEKREITKEGGDSSYDLKRIQNSLLSEKDNVIEGQRQLIQDLSSRLETLSHNTPNENENQSLPNEVDVKNFKNSVAAKVLLQSPMSLSPSSVEKTLYSDFFESQTALSKDEDDVSSVSC